MSDEFDPSTDFQSVTDGLETVTLSIAGEDDQEITSAHRNQATGKQPEPAGGDVKQGDTVWQWPVSASTRPPLGSTITDGDGEVWTILGLDRQVLGAKYSATCRNLAVEARLDTLVVIQQATYAKDSHGEAIPTWADLYTDVRAKVQPIAKTPEVEFDADTTDQTYRIILAADLAVTPAADLRVVDSDGNLYRVDDYQQPERIDALPVIEATWIGTQSTSSSSSGG